jgi:hypothetical protein
MDQLPMTYNFEVRNVYPQRVQGARFGTGSFLLALGLTVIVSLHAQTAPTKEYIRLGSPSAVSETLRQINDTGVSNAGAGAFLIQRLEGSRFGTVVLWVWNPYAVGENGRRREWTAGGHQSQPARDGFVEPTSLAAGDAGRGIALVVESPAKS